MQRVYFDHNATTPILPEVVDRMTAALRDEFGNPSSVHHFGQQAKAAIDEARSDVAALLGADPSEVLFTSGGTESDNIAIRGAAEALEPAGRRHLIASAIEHEAVLNTLKALAKRGWRTTLLPVGQSGIASPEALRDALADDTVLVSVMHANNEIGTIQPIAELARLARERGALFHTDAVQTAGKIPINVKTLGVDMLSISAHKFYGPKGVGALWIRRGLRVLPLLTGGRQERKPPGRHRKRRRHRRHGRRRADCAGQDGGGRRAPVGAAGSARGGHPRRPSPARRSTARPSRACRTRPTSASIASRPSRS